MRKQSILALAVLAVGLLEGQACADLTAYTITDLGTLGGSESCAFSVNDSGQIVGRAYDASENDRATWFDTTGAGVNVDLGTLGGERGGAAYSINDSGQIVGFSYNALSSWTNHATLFDPTGNGNNLELSANDSGAKSINNDGQIVGAVYFGGSTGWRAVLFDSSGEGSNLVLGGIFAESINDIGQIVGYGYGNLGEDRVILFDPTGNGNNVQLSDNSSQALSISNSGHIVGYEITAFGTHATLFDSTGGGNNVDLGPLNGVYTRTYANAINSNGQIVGYATSPSFDFRAVMFDSTGYGNNIDLNNLIDPSLGWELTMARGINNNGWIVGLGEIGGETHGFLLTPMATYCAETLLSDLNHDCRVDFLDFAIFVSQWLECRIEPPELCWQ